MKHGTWLVRWHFIAYKIHRFASFIGWWNTVGTHIDIYRPIKVQKLFTGPEITRVAKRGRCHQAQELNHHCFNGTPPTSRLFRVARRATCFVRHVFVGRRSTWSMWSFTRGILTGLKGACRHLTPFEGRLLPFEGVRAASPCEGCNRLRGAADTPHHFLSILPT